MRENIDGISDLNDLPIGEWVRTTFGGANINVAHEDEDSWSLSLMDGTGWVCQGRLEVSNLAAEGVETLALGWLAAITEAGN